MEIELRLYATLVKYAKKNKISQFSTVELEEELTLVNFLKKFGILHKHVRIVMVNGKRAELEQVLRDGDRVGLFPPVGGG
ncbi:MAG: MoaD/ThiS family protein [Candidatus Subteraquimicrobiales bacterium]|nr:MoaD/ThiS family protein [Candidatus Subteraquimicrobiales bacterium]